MKKIYCSNFGDEIKVKTLFQIYPPVLKYKSVLKPQNLKTHLFIITERNKKDTEKQKDK